MSNNIIEYTKQYTVNSGSKKHNLIDLVKARNSHGNPITNPAGIIEFENKFKAVRKATKKFSVDKKLSKLQEQIQKKQLSADVLSAKIQLREAKKAKAAFKGGNKKHTYDE